ncbi:hypothetical protein [Labilibacter marinus]|uniref:hypothetical protein n=1 Tax=Labilibacter marinus TaxID=1477105 RepID=UPI00095006C9|nr:hypothetical protein [Labilibacter marinus]
MKLNNLFIRLFFLASVVTFASCTKDDVNPDVKPTEMTSDNKWVEDEIKVGDELWYKVTCDAGSTTAYVEWAESAGQGEDRDYTGDVKISAFLMDGITPYIEDKDNGYGDKIKSFPLAIGEVNFLIKVTIGGTETPGTFALRAKTTSVITVDYADLEVSETWTELTIKQDEILGFKVKYDGSKHLAIVWKEVDSPDAAGEYTADIMGSVLHADGTTFYKDVAKGKDFLDKNKSHTGDEKYILTEADDKNIKIHIKNTIPGSFALKVYEYTE